MENKIKPKIKKEYRITFNPQQELFLKYFLDPNNSETFGNYTQSCLKAGFSASYADNISSLMPRWLNSALEDSSLVRKALDNLYDFIGNKKNPQIQWDATKFTLTRLNKEKFSERIENTGKGGKDLIPDPLSEEEKTKLKSLLNDTRSS